MRRMIWMVCARLARRSTGGPENSGGGGNTGPAPEGGGGVNLMPTVAMSGS